MTSKWCLDQCPVVTDSLPTVTALIRGPFGRYVWNMQLRHLPREQKVTRQLFLTSKIYVFTWFATILLLERLKPSIYLPTETYLLANLFSFVKQFSCVIYAAYLQFADTHERHMRNRLVCLWDILWQMYVCVDVYERCVGVYERCVGVYERCVGMYERFVGVYAVCVKVYARHVC